jgi:hypothetical protein
MSDCISPRFGIFLWLARKETAEMLEVTKHEYQDISWICKLIEIG